MRIIDRTAEPGTTSRAVAVQARTLEFYREMDLADAVVTGGVKVSGVNLWTAGAKAAHVPLQRMGEGLSPFPYPLTFPQDLHERLLIQRLESLGVHVERRTELVRFDQNPQGVRAVLKRNSGDEETCEAAYLAGCDGADSTVREALGIEFPGGTYTGLFYVADVDASGPAADGEIHVEIDQAEFLAVFPLKGEGRLRLVGPIAWEPSREKPRADLRRHQWPCHRKSQAHHQQGELVLDLSRASPRGERLPQRTRLSPGRRGTRAQPGRRPGNEHRHRRRRQPRMETRRGAARGRERKSAGDV